MSDSILMFPTLNQEFHRRLREGNLEETYEIRLKTIEAVYRQRKQLILEKEKGGMDEATYWQQRCAALYDELVRIQKEYGITSMFLTKRRSNPLNKPLNQQYGGPNT